MQNTAPELLHFPLTLFPTAASFSTTFKALFPAPCLGAKHQGWTQDPRRCMDAHPPTPGMLCLGGTHGMSPAVFTLDGSASPFHCLHSLGESARKQCTAQPSKTRGGQKLLHGFLEMAHTGGRSACVLAGEHPALTAQLPTLAPAHTTSLPGMRFCDLGGRKVLGWVVPVQSTAPIPLRCGTHGFRNNPVFITLSN